jgi:DNA-binding response OmpR family regulator
MVSASAPHSEGGSGPHPVEGAPRVLVIDDSQTILKVVGTILHLEGFDVALARDGVEGFQQLEQTGPYDIILLDFVMPRMNGYQFCRKLRSDDKHKGVPVVLMSARTATIGDRFVEQTGAVDALNKPFDARALVAVVQSVLSKQARHSRPRVMPRPEQMLDEADLDVSHAEEAPPPSRHVRSLDHVGHTIGRAVAPHLARLTPADLSQPQRIEELVAKVIDESVIAQIAQALGDIDLGAHSQEMLRGRLAKMPLAEVLQLLQLRRQTGLVHATHQRMSMTLCIRDGMLELAQSSGTDVEFRLGRYFVEAGWLSREEIEAELEAYAGSGKLFGEWLLEKGLIDEEHLHHALMKQSCELVYEVLRWPDGRFILSEEPLPEAADKARLGLGISELVLEGFRRVDEWRHMADTIDFDAILVVDQVTLGTVDDDKIGLIEHQVLRAVDGKRTAREVMEASEVTSFDAIQALYRFLQSRIVREVKRSRASSSGLSAIAPGEATDGGAAPAD